MGDRGENYRVEGVFGIISSRTNQKTGEVTEVKLTRTGWFGRPAKWDLRNWTGNYAGSGCVIGFDKDLFRLRDLLNDVCAQLEAEDADED